MLEGAWEALEDSGIDPAGLMGTRTGVYTGVMYRDYGWGLSPEQDSAAYLSTGGSSGIVSGRISYTLGLEGPSISVDTACSSSLVAMHLASHALRAGECTLALAGGVSVFSTPVAFIQFSGQRGLSPDGRCKAFSDAADGAGFGEGAGMLVLERLSDAAPQRSLDPRDDPRLGDQPGRRLQRPHRPQRPLPGAGDPARPWPDARLPPPRSTRSRPTAPAPPSAIRSRRAPCSPPTAGTGRSR